MTIEILPTLSVQAGPTVKECYKVIGAKPDRSSPKEFCEHRRRETVKLAHPTKFLGAKPD
jgi:hypothetical protein